MEGAASSRVAHERDFLQELERQREQGGDGAFSPTIREDEAAALVSSPRIERTAGENAAATARDVRRRRPGDPELPPPQVTPAGATPAARR